MDKRLKMYIFEFDRAERVEREVWILAFGWWRQDWEGGALAPLCTQFWCG